MKKLTALFLLILCLCDPVFTQNPTWVNFTSGTEILSMTHSGAIIWVGTGGGLARINRQTGESKYYNSCNSGMIGNEVNALVSAMTGKSGSGQILDWQCLMEIIGLVMILQILIYLEMKDSSFSCR